MKNFQIEKQANHGKNSKIKKATNRVMRRKARQIVRTHA